MLLNQSIKNSVFTRHFLFKQTMSTLKTSMFFPLRRKPVVLNKSEFKLLYNFPFIRFVSAVISSGRTNIFLSATTSPIIYYYYESMLPCLAVLGAACAHFAMVLVASSIFKNIVGKIYVNKEGEVKDVLISSTDEFGKRIDRIHNADELINCEYFTKLSGQLGLIHISVENSDIQYVVNVRNCKIHDPFIWENLFGTISVSEMIRKKPNKEIKMKRIG